MTADVIDTAPAELGSFISGEKVGGRGSSFNSINPATGSVIARVATASSDDIDSAVASALQAQREWASLTAGALAQAMWRWADLIDAETEALARLDMRDMGKLLHEARMEIPAAARAVRYWSSVAARPEDTSLPTVAGHFSYTRREPIGVVGIILPWNGPAITFVSRVASAIACGNSVVVKPSELSPISAIRLAEIAVEAGLPCGLVNVVQGDGKVGQALVGHPDVRGISFTGSVATGRAIATQAAADFTSTVLELGGKGPVVVFDDADLAEVARASVWGCFQNAGQVCCAGTRLLVSRNRQAELEDRLAALTAKVRVGDPEDSGSQIGPLVSERQLGRVQQHVQDAVAAGASPTVGGGRLDRPGYYFEPTLFTGLSPDLPLVSDEIFGPVLVTVPFDSEEEAIALANNGSYGLAAMVWTADGSRGFRMAEALESGVIWVNTPRLMDPSLPFGGYKDSGVGNASGPAAIEGLTRLKRVSTRTSAQQFAGWGD